jgi:hypothetical protein
LSKYLFFLRKGLSTQPHLQETADDVVNKALEYVFSKDKDFQQYLTTAAAKAAHPTLRVKSSGNGAAKGRRAAKGTASTGERA